LSWQTDLIGLTTPTKGNVNLDPFGYVDEEDLALLTEWVNNGLTEDALTPEQWAQADIVRNDRLDEDDLDALTWYLENPKINPIN